MRRRQQSDGFPVEPPARLRAFDPADWPADDADYDPDAYRCRANGLPYGRPALSLPDWRRQQAGTLWMRARLDWLARYGWPGGLDVVDLLRQSAQARRAEYQRERPRG